MSPSSHLRKPFLSQTIFTAVAEKRTGARITIYAYECSSSSYSEQKAEKRGRECMRMLRSMEKILMRSNLLLTLAI